jgi:hypothetical protein
MRCESERGAHALSPPCLKSSCPALRRHAPCRLAPTRGPRRRLYLTSSPIIIPSLRACRPSIHPFDMATRLSSIYSIHIYTCLELAAHTSCVHSTHTTRYCFSPTCMTRACVFGSYQGPPFGFLQVMLMVIFFIQTFLDNRLANYYLNS